MRRGFRLSQLLLLAALVGCEPDPSPGDSDDLPPGDSDLPIGDAEAEQVLYVPDGPADLELGADGSLLVVTRYGGDVLAWTPGSKATDSVQRSIAGLEGVHRAAETLWAATSDGGIVGAVGWLEDSELQPVASQADDGTLFRYPRDLVLAPDGALLMADATVGALFRTELETGSTTAYYVEIASPRALLFDDGVLYVGGSDGVFTVDYPGSSATLIDPRPANALLAVGDRILASNADQKIFALDGASLGGADVGNPGGMAVIDDTLFVSDLGGRYLYAMPLD
jgi:hypothetical protein